MMTMVMTMIISVLVGATSLIRGDTGHNARNTLVIPAAATDGG
jgi:hypothetical protein